MTNSKQRNRAEKDGWSDGVAGVHDDTLCPYLDEDKRANYAKGRAEGYAAYLKARAAAEPEDQP